MNPPASAAARAKQSPQLQPQPQADGWSPQPQRIKRHRTGGDVTKGLGALLVLVLLLGAVPAALVRYIGWPLPHQMPSSHFFNQPITPQVLLNALAVIVWLAWAQFAACVVVEFRAAVRGIGMPARVPAAGPSQFLARQLIAALLMITASAASFVPNLSHLGPHAAPPSAAVPPAATAGVLPGGTQHPAIAPYPANAAGAANVAGAYTNLPAVRGESGLRVASDTAATLSPDGTKLYRVQPPHGRHHDTLWEIAQRHLGDGRRYREIFELNKDRVQPDGSKLTNAALIRPGWILMMPADATGGDLVVEMPPTSPEALSPAQSSGVQSGSAPTGSFQSNMLQSDAPQSDAAPQPASPQSTSLQSAANQTTPLQSAANQTPPPQPASPQSAPTQPAPSQTASSALKPVPSTALPPIIHLPVPPRPSTPSAPTADVAHPSSPITQSADELAKLATAAATAGDEPTSVQSDTGTDIKPDVTADTNKSTTEVDQATSTPPSTSSALAPTSPNQLAPVANPAPNTLTPNAPAPGTLIPGTRTPTTSAALTPVPPPAGTLAARGPAPLAIQNVPALRPSHRGAHSPEESQPPSTDNRVLYGLAASPLLAAGLLKALGRHRRRQLWNRVFGRRPVTPTGDGAVAEESIRVGASEVEVWFLDLALRGLSAGLAERGLTVPGAYATRLRDEGIEVLLNKPVAPDDPAAQPPSPWFTAPDGRSWNFPRPGIVDVDAQAAHRRFAPYPGLVTIGTTTRPARSTPRSITPDSTPSTPSDLAADSTPGTIAARTNAASAAAISSPIGTVTDPLTDATADSAATPTIGSDPNSAPGTSTPAIASTVGAPGSATPNPSAGSTHDASTGSTHDASTGSTHDASAGSTHDASTGSTTHDPSAGSTAPSLSPSLSSSPPSSAPSPLSPSSDLSDRVMIDLEEARGLIGLDGPPEVRRAVLAAMAVELATNSWSDRMTVTLVGFPGDLTPLAPARVRHVRTLDEILPSLEIEAGERAKALTAAGLESVLDGRSRATQASSFPPHFVLVSEEPHAAILARLAAIATTAARVGLGFVVAGNPPGATWQLTVSSDRRIAAPALGIEAHVQLLPEEQYAAVLGLFRAVCDIEGTDITARPANQSVGYGGPLPDEPPAVLAALLGPLEVTGVGDVEPESTPLLNEALVFLLHHRDGVHPRVLAAALWPRGTTADVAEATFARLSDWLGTDPHGQPNLHTDPDGRLRLGPYVWSDWDVFVSLQSRALYDASIPDQKQRDEMLRRALDLVRGPYLADREPNRYGWLAYEVAEAQVPAVIADTALQLADSYVASDAPEAAIEAVKSGMRGSPDDEELWRGLLRATSATQDTERLRGAIEGLYKRTWYVHGVQGLHPRTEALVNELMPHWRELVAA